MSRGKMLAVHNDKSLRTWEEVARLFREKTGKPCTAKSACQCFRHAVIKLQKGERCESRP